MLKEINIWRVLAYAAFAISGAGLWTALLLDQDALQWATPAFVSVLWVRLEWVIRGLKDAAKSYVED